MKCCKSIFVSCDLIIEHLAAIDCRLRVKMRVNGSLFDRLCRGRFSSTENPHLACKRGSEALNPFKINFGMKCWLLPDKFSLCAIFLLHGRRSSLIANQASLRALHTSQLTALIAFEKPITHMNEETWRQGTISVYRLAPGNGAQVRTGPDKGIGLGDDDP